MTMVGGVEWSFWVRLDTETNPCWCEVPKGDCRVGLKTPNDFLIGATENACTAWFRTPNSNTSDREMSDECRMLCWKWLFLVVFYCFNCTMLGIKLFPYAWKEKTHVSGFCENITPRNVSLLLSLSSWYLYKYLYLVLYSTIPCMTWFLTRSVSNCNS